MKRLGAIPLWLFVFSQAAWRGTALARGELSGTKPRDYVVLLHGLGRTSWSMKKIEWQLNKEGYSVINVSYPSTRLSIEGAADHWLAGMLEERATNTTARIHFVTHSLGGIVLRQYLLEHHVENLGRVVMLAPPNRGSELVDRFHRSPLYRIFTGPAGQQLGTGRDSLPNRLGPADFELGIIAGDRSVNPVLSPFIPGRDDGKVSVHSTTLEGLKEFRIVHHSHTWMIWRKDVIAAVSRFLKDGTFGPAG